MTSAADTYGNVRLLPRYRTNASLLPSSGTTRLSTRSEAVFTFAIRSTMSRAAVVAAMPGLVDYVFAVPPRSSAQKRATDHMFANVSALMLFTQTNSAKTYDFWAARGSIQKRR